MEENRNMEQNQDQILAELASYQKMQQAVEKEFQSIVDQMEKLKGEGRTRSATYRQLMGRKLTYGNMLDLYRLYDLKE